eukprot:m.77524 g.77524  ORF g.77524 m.77524 type:complete len:500 (+) comp9147_c0_seq2:232-1731(+)
MWSASSSVSGSPSRTPSRPPSPLLDPLVPPTNDDECVDDARYDGTRANEPVVQEFTQAVHDACSMADPKPGAAQGCTCSACCYDALVCSLCPCRVIGAVCVGMCGCSVCGVAQPPGTNRGYDVIRRVIRQGASTLPRWPVCCPRLFTDNPLPTCCGCCRCLLGVPGGTVLAYKKIDPSSTEVKSKGRWAYPRSQPAPTKFLTEASPFMLNKSRWIVYMHGGGFNLCKTWSYSHILRFLAAKTGAYVVAPRYRRAPEHKHPAAVNDCLATYQWLARRVPPERIMLMGDSAGGALVSMVLSRLVDAGAPVPGGAVLVSPWVDLEDFESDSWSKERGGGRDFITKRLCVQYARNYAGSPADPTASATRCTLTGFPPLMVQSGQDECFASQVAEYVRKVKAAGVDCRHTETQHAVHVPPVFFGTKAPVATTSLSDIVEFMTDMWQSQGRQDADDDKNHEDAKDKTPSRGSGPVEASDDADVVIEGVTLEESSADGAPDAHQYE